MSKIPKLKCGMYVRYKNKYDNIVKISKIKKILTVKTPYLKKYYNLEGPDGALKEEIIKASYNILEVIEIGDYINGYKIVDFDLSYKSGNVIALAAFGNTENGLRTWNFWIKNNEIKSILTKNQFETNSYKIRRNK